MLVHPLSALLSSAHAWDLVGVVLKVELVVVAQLLAPHDPTVGEDDDVVVSVDLDRLGHAVRVATVIDVPAEKNNISALNLNKGYHVKNNFESAHFLSSTLQDS